MNNYRAKFQVRSIYCSGDIGSGSKRPPPPQERPMPIGRAKPLRRARFARTFCLVKNKTTLDLQVFSRIGKTIKNLQRIPNTIMNASLPVIF